MLTCTPCCYIHTLATFTQYPGQKFHWSRRSSLSLITTQGLAMWSAVREQSVLPYDAELADLVRFVVQWASHALGGGPCHGKLAEPAHQKALEKSLGIKEQSCPMLQLSHQAVWWSPQQGGAHTYHMFQPNPACSDPPPPAPMRCIQIRITRPVHFSGFMSCTEPWGNVCPACARRATLVLSILALAPGLSSPRGVPQVDRTGPQTFPAKHVWAEWLHHPCLLGGGQ